MEREAAEHLVHIQGWLVRVDEMSSEARTLTWPTGCCRRPATRCR